MHCPTAASNAELCGNTSHTYNTTPRIFATLPLFCTSQQLDRQSKGPQVMAFVLILQNPVPLAQAPKVGERGEMAGAIDESQIQGGNEVAHIVLMQRELCQPIPLATLLAQVSQSIKATPNSELLT